MLDSFFKSRIRELENFFLVISWKLRKKSVSLQREHKIAKIWQDTGEVYSNKIRFIYLVMPLFKKKEEECTTFLDCWIYNLKHMETLEQMPFEAQHKIFKRLAEIADSKSLTKEEQEKYDNSMMVMWDNYAVYKHAEEKGLKKGMEKGIEKGEKKRNKEIALNLLAYNTPIDVIAKSTGLSIEEIKELEQYN